MSGWYSCLHFSLTLTLEFTSLERFHLQMWSKQWRRTAHSSLGLVTEPYSPCPSDFCNSQQQGFCLKDLELLLAMTTALVG